MPNPHTMVLRQPAARWQDALPTGNGTIGAMAYGSIRNETILLNHEIEPLADLKERVKGDTIERARRRLRATDFKVLQHLEETAAGITPTMSMEDFQTMVQKRKVIRDALAQFEQAVDAAADRDAVNAIAKP